MSDAIQTVLTVAGGVLGALLTAWGAVRVARLASKAQLKTAEIEEAKVRASAYTEARESYRELVADLRKEISGVRSAQEEDRARHRQELTEQDERQRRQIADLREERRQHDTALNNRIDELESQRDSDKHRIEALETRNDALDAYVRKLIRAMRDSNLVPPPAPPGETFE